MFEEDSRRLLAQHPQTQIAKFGSGTARAEEIRTSHAGYAGPAARTVLPDRGVIPSPMAIGGRLAEVLYYGAAPGYPGYDQVSFRMPGCVAPGPAAPVRLTYLGRSNNEVTVGVR